jgi:predicted amidohydrolase YtcJ
VVKDTMTGEPTGELRERAQFLVKRRDSTVDPETLAERIAVELEKRSHRGVTCVHDIIMSKEEVQAYQLLARARRLPVRVHLLILKCCANQLSTPLPAAYHAAHKASDIL